MYKNPIDLLNDLKLTVVDQDELCKTLAGAYFQYLFYHYNKAKGLNTKSPKILILGDSGCGKTFAVQELARLLNMNFIEINGATITQEGFVGMGLSDLIKNYEKIINSSIQNIVFIDEFDKLCIPNPSLGGGDTAYRIQAELLKIVEMAEWRYDTKDMKFNLNMDNVLWVFAGAFQEVRKKIHRNTDIGFASKEHNTSIKEIELKNALISHGVLPELVGRLSVFAEAKELDKNGLLNIILNDKGYYRVNQEALNQLGISFAHDIDKLLNKVYNIAKENKIGARAIHEAIDEELQKVLFEHPQQMALIVEYFEYLKKGEEMKEEFTDQQRKRLGLK